MAKPEGITPARSDTKRSANTDAASGPPNGPNTLASPLDRSTTCTTCGSSKRFASHAAIIASTRAATDETGTTDLRFNCRRMAPSPRRPSARKLGGGGILRPAHCLHLPRCHCPSSVRQSVPVPRRRQPLSSVPRSARHAPQARRGVRPRRPSCDDPPRRRSVTGGCQQPVSTPCTDQRRRAR